MLTPIRVPGKNKRSQRRDARSRGHKEQSVRPIGRPPWVSQSLTSSTSALRDNHALLRRKKKRTLRNIKSRRKMSRLERLPTELLETIFLSAMNPALPMASPVIAGKLSNQHVYIETILNAFGPTWKDSYEEACLQAANTITPGEAEFTGDPLLQTALLRLRWVRLPVLQRAEEIWLHRMSITLPRPDFGSETESTRLQFQSASFDQDFENFCKLVEQRGSQTLWSCQSLRHVFRGPLAIHPKTEIPESLLGGSWSKDELMQLFWFARAGAQIDLLHSTGGEVAKEGLAQAVKDGDIAVLYIFQAFGIHEIMDETTLQWAVQNAGGDKIAITTRLFCMLNDKHSGDHSMWSGWISSVQKAAHQRGRTLEERKQERLWVEDFTKMWLDNHLEIK